MSALDEVSFFEVDLIEVDDLLNSATRLLEEVYSTQPIPVPDTSVLSSCVDAMQEVQRFFNSIREPKEEDDVVFLEARPGNAPPASVRIAAVVDLCTPNTADESTPDMRAYRRLFPELNPTPNCFNAPTRIPRLQAMKEPNINVKPTIIHVPSPVTPVSNSIRSPDDGYGMPALTCAVCMESVLKRQPTSTSCGHIFCQACIMQAVRLTNKCPLCNSKLLNQTQLHRVYF